MLGQFNLLNFRDTGTAMVNNNNLREQFVRDWGNALQDLINIEQEQEQEQEPNLLQEVIQIARSIGINILPPNLQAADEEGAVELSNHKDEDDDEGSYGIVASISATQDIFTLKQNNELITSFLAIQDNNLQQPLSGLSEILCNYNLHHSIF